MRSKFECLVQLFVCLCLRCLKRGLGVVCKCFLAKNVIYVCGSFFPWVLLSVYIPKSTSIQFGYPVYVNGTIDRDTVSRLNARLGLTLF